MKIAHVCNYAPGLSGMYGSVRELCIAERNLGEQAEIIDDVASTSLYGIDGIIPVSFDYGDEADIICWHHAMHENWFNEPHRNIVLFLHGTPEYNFFTELYEKERSFSLIIGLANMKIPKRIITMWKRHVPFWENLLQTKVDYIPIWSDTNFQETKRVPSKDKIKIGMLDFWRISREPFSLFMAIDYLRKHSKKKIEVDVWGLLDTPNNTYMAAIQWMIEDGTVILKGNTKKPDEDIYSQCDLILTMSTEETRVIREAYGMGVPVVCGRNVKGFTKYSADCIDPIELAKIINKCHNDLCNNTEETRKSLIEYSMKHFDIKKSSQKVVKIFNEVIDKYGSVNNPKSFSKFGIRMVYSVHDTCDVIKERIENNKPVSYLRFGDGEYMIMAGIDKIDWAKNTPEFREELTESFLIKDEGYLIGSVAGSTNEGRMRKGLFASFEYDEGLRNIVEELRPKETLHSAVALAYKSVFHADWFVDFLEKCIRNKSVVLIANEKICNNRLVKSTFSVNHCICVPEKNAYQWLTEENYKKIEEAAKKYDVILCSAGMTSEIIAKRLWENGIKKIFLDIGSIPDALAGVESRTWIKLVGEEFRSNYGKVFEKDNIDIIVPTYNNSEVTKKCFESIAQNTSNYRVIWIDNASSNEEIEKVKESARLLENCDLIRNQKNEGFSIAVNKGLKKSLQDNWAKYIVLLNNDVIVSKCWIENLISSLEKNNFEAIGPLTSENNPHSLDALRSVLPELPKFTKESLEERAEILLKNYGTKCFESGSMLSFFCCLIKPSCFEKVGLLDENLFMYGEDNDWFYRCKLSEIKFGISLGTYVHHNHMSSSIKNGIEWVEERKKEAKIYLENKYKKT